MLDYKYYQLGNKIKRCLIKIIAINNFTTVSRQQSKAIVMYKSGDVEVKLSGCNIYIKERVGQKKQVNIV